MAKSITQQDYRLVRQKNIRKYVRIDLLDFNYNIVDEISGSCISFNYSEDATSDLRRSCNIALVVNDSSFDIKSGGKIWLDKYIRPYIGYQDNRTDEIVWYNKGIFLINAPSWNYNGSTNTLSFSALDLMSKLTGLRNGNLEGIPTKIEKGANVREAMIAAIALGGFDKYVISECINELEDGKEYTQEVPYDIEIDQGGTIYDILTSLRDILPNYEIFFDENGVFHYQPIPTGDDETIVADDDLFNEVLIDETIDTDFENVKNYIEVYGHTWDVDYYSDSTTTVVSGTAITPTFANLPLLIPGVVVSLALPVDVIAGDGASVVNSILTVTGDNSYENEVAVLSHGVVSNGVLSLGSGGNITIELLGSHNVVGEDGAPITFLEKNKIYIFSYKEDGTFVFLGGQQSQATVYDDNPNSPFYVGDPVGSSSVGVIRIVLAGGDYDNIYSDNLAKQRAQFELYQRCRLQDSIGLTTVPIPWLEVHTLLSHAIKGGDTQERYIIKSINVDYGTANGTMTISAMKYYPYYPI